MKPQKIAVIGAGDGVGRSIAHLLTSATWQVSLMSALVRPNRTFGNTQESILKTGKVVLPVHVSHKVRKELHEWARAYQGKRKY